MLMVPSPVTRCGWRKMLARVIIGSYWLTLLLADAGGQPTGGVPEITAPELCVGHYHPPEKGKAQLDRFRQTFFDAESWRRRAAATRKQILVRTGLDPLPARTPTNPVIRKRRVHDGYTVESMAFEPLPGYFVFASLYRPAVANGRSVAAVLSTHGHWVDPNGGGRFRPDNQLRNATLARMGCIVLAPDMLGFGESRDIGWKHETIQALPLQLWSNIRALDFLCSLPEVDPVRIAVTGASGGGTQAFQLSAVDDRIAVSIPVCMVSSHFFGGCICESGLPIHRTPEHETNNVDIAAAFAPKPQLLISVGGDWTQFTPQVEFPYLQDVYRLFEAEANVENAHFPDEKHDYGISKRTAMYAFMAKHLNIDLAQVDEDKVTLEPREEMTILDHEFTLPSRALPPNETITWPPSTDVNRSSEQP